MACVFSVCVLLLHWTTSLTQAQEHGKLDENSEASKSIFHGKYIGPCEKSGFYYHDSESYLVCANGRAYQQPCAPGTRNSGYNKFASGDNYKAHDFCDENLVNHGFARPQYDNYYRANFPSSLAEDWNEDSSEQTERAPVHRFRYSRWVKMGKYGREEDNYGSNEDFGEYDDMEKNIRFVPQIDIQPEKESTTRYQTEYGLRQKQRAKYNEIYHRADERHAFGFNSFQPANHQNAKQDFELSKKSKGIRPRPGFIGLDNSDLNSKGYLEDDREGDYIKSDTISRQYRPTQDRASDRYDPRRAERVEQSNYKGLNAFPKKLAIQGDGDPDQFVSYVPPGVGGQEEGQLRFKEGDSREDDIFEETSEQFPDNKDKYSMDRSREESYQYKAPEGYESRQPKEFSDIDYADLESAYVYLKPTRSKLTANRGRYVNTARKPKKLNRNLDPDENEERGGRNNGNDDYKNLYVQKVFKSREYATSYDNQAIMDSLINEKPNYFKSEAGPNKRGRRVGNVRRTATQRRDRQQTGLNANK